MKCPECGYAETNISLCKCPLCEEGLKPTSAVSTPETKIEGESNIPELKKRLIKLECGHNIVLDHTVTKNIPKIPKSLRCHICNP